MTHKHRVFTTVVLLTVIGFPSWLVYREARQMRLARLLIGAVKENNTRHVVTALKQGANPNALDLPEDTRTFWQVLADQFRRKPRDTEGAAAARRRAGAAPGGGGAGGGGPAAH